MPRTGPLPGSFSTGQPINHIGTPMDPGHRPHRKDVPKLPTRSVDGQTVTAPRRPPGSPLGSLLEGASRGDWVAWTEIVNRFGPLVLYTAGQTGLNSADAADVAQQTWVLLWKHGHQIREPNHLAAWLVVAARREAIRLATASLRNVPCADPETEYSSHASCGSRDVYPVEGDYGEVVTQALDRLPPRYRALLLLTTSDLSLSYAEISRELDIPIGSIGPMRMRALGMLENTPEFRDGRFPRPALAKIAS